MDILEVISRPDDGLVRRGNARRGNLRIGVRIVSDLLERRFAKFAGVPYHGPLSRQHWEELWEAETHQR